MNTTTIFRKRGKSKIEFDYTMDDIFFWWRKEILKKYKTKLKISKQTFCRILKELNEETFNTIIDTNLEFKMPNGTGILSIKKVKKIPRISFKTGKISHTLPIDWKKTRELWLTNPEAKEKKKRIFQMNEHSNGWGYSYYWTKNKISIPGKKVYIFKPSRGNSRLLASKVKENPSLDFYCKYKEDQKYS